MPVSDHEACVRAWFGDERLRASTALLVRCFEEGFARVWQRACPTLGDITLVAIADRVLRGAAARHAELAEVEVDRAGLRNDTLEALRDVERRALDTMLQEVLVQLLTVVGRLTAEILTPALHQALEVDAREHPALRETRSTETRASGAQKDGTS